MDKDLTQGNRKWPKLFPPLTLEQERISNDFMEYWHQVLPKKYGIVDKFNHSYAVNFAPKNFLRTLEIGAGNGEHLKYEKLTQLQEDNYYAVDIRANMIAVLNKQFPKIHSLVADCQEQMPFMEGYFDRILAIHVLEHLPDLPRAVAELYRLSNKSTGVLSVVIPCEGSMAYSLARSISAKRVFERRYKQSYQWLIEREHINIPSEIFEELNPYFSIDATSYFPTAIPLEFCNLCIGITFRPRKTPLC